MPTTVIVGGGIMGCATAYYLRKLAAERTVIIVEQCAIACHSSGKAGGFLAKKWCDHSAVGSLAHASFALHKEIREEAASKGVVAADEYPLGYRDIGAVDGNGDSLGTPSDCAQVDPKRLTEYLLEESAAEVRLHGVTGLAFDKDGKVTGVKLTTGDLIACDSVVSCLGAWSFRLREWLPESVGEKLKMPTRTWDERHTAIVFENAVMPPQAVFTAAGPELYPRPYDQLYVCGDDKGARKNGDSDSIPDDPLTITPTAESTQELFELAAGHLTLSDQTKGQPKVIRSTSCYLPLFAGGAPTIGPLPGVPNLFVAAGHSCWGILNGPATGKMLAQLVHSGTTDVVQDPKPFHPDKLRK
ncbi:putative oxidoreductase C1F5.03c [Diplonema papillatum]|nr:putative oxidoreductase C1F5.03c [Diplonema papillatum]